MPCLFEEIVEVQLKVATYRDKQEKGVGLVRNANRFGEYEINRGKSLFCSD